MDNVYFDRIFQFYPAPTLILRADAPIFTVVEVNDAYLKIANLDRADCIGKSFFELFGIEVPVWRESLNKVMANKAAHLTPTQRYEMANDDDLGTSTRYFDALNVPILNDDNQVELIIRSVTDVTDKITIAQKAALVQDHLLYNKSSLTETEQIARIGNWEIDFEQNTYTWSSVLKGIFEVDDHYQPDFDHSTIFYKEGPNRETIIRAVTASIERGTPFDVTLEVITAKGNHRWLRSNGKAEFSEGKCRRLFGTTQDITDKKLTDLALTEAKDKFQSLIQTVDGIVWEADASTFKFSFISDKVKTILGYTPEEWLATPDFWRMHIHPDDRNEAVNYCRIETEQGRNHRFDYRMIKANAEVIWIRDIISVISENGKPRWLRGLMLDITETKRLTDLDLLEKTVLELNAYKNSSIEDVLTLYLRGIETMFNAMSFSIMQVKNGRLHSWAAPSLPQAYIDSIENLQIGPNSGSCGTAAYLKETIISVNIETDPRWADYKHLALVHQLRACWSYPVINADGEVLAVFGIYYREEKSPQQTELLITERLAAILKIVLENRHNSDVINETALLMTQGQELANFGNWQWDIRNNLVTWSDTLYKIYGLNKNEFKATFEGYQELLHPDDKERIYKHIQAVLSTHQDSVFEERIIRPGGEIRHLKSWGRLQLDDAGQPIKMLGACLDTTDSKKSELKLKELHDQLEAHVEVLSVSEKKYSDLFHLSPQPMWIYEFNTLKFADVNDSAIGHYGYTREEFLQMTILDLWDAGEGEKFIEAINTSGYHAGRKHFGIFRHKKKDGTIIQVDILSNVIQFDGKTTGIVLATDVTDRQNYIEAIENKNGKLQEIAWIQSHIVRAPLAKIMSLVELLKDRDLSEYEQADLLGKMAVSAHQLDLIIRDISDRAGEIELISDKV